MKILIVGANSHIGARIYSQMDHSKHAIIGTYCQHPADDLSHLDITNENSVRDFSKKYNPDLIIHLSAITSTDFCQENPKIAREIHVEGTKRLLSHFDSRFIFSSTNVVFYGPNTSYYEDDFSNRNPRSVYGKTKVEAEDAVLENGGTVVRFDLVLSNSKPYQPQQAFNEMVISKLRKGDTINLWTDYLIKPLSNFSVAEGVEKLVDYKGKRRIFHLAGKNQVSSEQLGLMVAQIFGLDSSFIKPIPRTPKDLETRPSSVSLSTSLTERDLQWKPRSLNESLLELKKELQPVS
ncbi:MAG: sugar nucleotide-binding protein [Candidatus Aenigmarchaeota archaeon]|nr:sugar nucleotide-binding protein [Candidatus Aenigmarchaeota archaeon]